MPEEKKEENEYLVPEDREQFNLGRNQKIAVAVLGVFGVFIIIFWFVQFNRTLSQSLIPNETADNGTSDTNVDSNGNILSTQANKDDARLKNQDTDGDSLSDWDELNNYHTSPYLADTDGDGISDGVEVKNGTDPNCLQGQTCNHSDLLAASSTDSTTITNTTGATDNGLGSLLNSALNSSSQSGDNTVNNSASLPSSNNMSAASLRAELINSGFDQNALNNISDTDLLKLYQESLNNLGGN